VGQLADVLPVTRPAVSQHLRILKDAGLVIEQPEGARRLYSISPEGLTELREYLDGMWGDALESFKRQAVKKSRQRGPRKQT
jgi:DNA-binding transcriptional ArsR family regulator